MAEKIQVSYAVIGAYVAFVVISTLLVGLLPPLVNRPTCDDKSVYSVPEAPSAVAQKDTADPLKLAPKRHAPVLRERRRLPRSTQFHDTRRLMRPNRQAYDDIIYPVCLEVNENQQPNSFPWQNIRLPDSVVPVNYEFDLSLPGWGNNLTLGYMDITFNVLQPTNYIIFHSRDERDSVEFLINARGESVNISCTATYAPNDYYVIRTQNMLQPSDGPFKVEIQFSGDYPASDIGLFTFEFDIDNSNAKSQMSVTYFEPVFARRAFPCFDEPRFKASFTVQLFHLRNKTSLSNMPIARVIPEIGNPDVQETVFQASPRLPTYLVAFLVFDSNDFQATTATTNGIMINLWARTSLVKAGLATEPLKLIVDLIQVYLDIFSDVDKIALPSKLDVFAIPEYSIEAVPHYGLFIFRESNILFDNIHASERDKQNIGLLISKQLAELWFGNFVTFGWWDQLWLQEGLANYVKYEALERIRPEWNIRNQFIVDELIYALVEDSYPLSPPIQTPVSTPAQIEEEFKKLTQTAKVTGILRMVENVKSEAAIIDALVVYLNANKWDTADVNDFYNALGTVDKWPAKDFFDRWIRQSNYPLVTVELVNRTANQQGIRVTQKREINSRDSVFAQTIVYPSPYNWVWYVPLFCSFGINETNGAYTSEQEFYIDQADVTLPLTVPAPLGTVYTWVHCDRKFTGYFGTEYKDQNWETLGRLIRNKNLELLPEDQANVFHNLFVNAFANRLDYKVLTDVLVALRTERDYLPWRTVSKHMHDLFDLLDHRRSFYPASNFLTSIMRDVENDLDLWNPSPDDFHIQKLLKETITELGCRAQDAELLTQTEKLWTLAVPDLISGNYNNSLIPPYLRSIVFNYHIQNTYNVEDWGFLFLEYNVIIDPIERQRFLSALSFSKLPWLLARFFDTEENRGVFGELAFFDEVALLSQNPLGRELIWDYIRSNFDSIIATYGDDDVRVGQMLIDVTHSFETSLLYNELLDFAELTDSGTIGQARYNAIERVSTNVLLLRDREEEIEFAFEDPRKRDQKHKQQQQQQPRMSSAGSQQVSLAQMDLAKLNERARQLIQRNRF